MAMVTPIPNPGHKSSPMHFSPNAFHGPRHVEVSVSDSYGPHLGNFLSKSIDRCYFLISPNTPYETYDWLQLLFSWILRHCSHLAVIEGGYLDRWNLIYLHNMTEKDAEKRSLQRSKSIQKRVNRVAESLNATQSVSMLSYTSLMDHDIFSRSCVWLNNLRLVPKFSDALRRQVQDYTDRKNLCNVPEFTLKGLENYVVEEMAIEMTLHSIQYSIECYPGPDLDINRMIVSGEFGSAPVDIGNHTFVSLSADGGS